MSDPAALIVALTGLIAAIWSIVESRSKARRDELDDLRERVEELTRENAKLHKENIRLREFVASLTVKLVRSGIEVPTMPAMYWDPDREIWTREPKEGE